MPCVIQFLYGANMMLKYFLIIVCAIFYSSTVCGSNMAQDIEFYNQDEETFTRVGFSYVRGAPNPLTLPPEEGRVMPHPIETWIKKENLTIGSVNDVVARYGYGWMFFDIPNNESVLINTLLAYVDLFNIAMNENSPDNESTLENTLLADRLPDLIEQNNALFRSVCAPLCLELYTQARNKVENIIECDVTYTYNEPFIYINRFVLVNIETVLEFRDALFYAYGGTLQNDGTNGNCWSELKLPLWDGALKCATKDGRLYSTLYPNVKDITVVFFPPELRQTRIQAGLCLNNRVFNIRAKRTPEGKLYIKGLATVYDNEGNK